MHPSERGGENRRTVWMWDSCGIRVTPVVHTVRHQLYCHLPSDRPRKRCVKQCSFLRPVAPCTTDYAPRDQRRAALHSLRCGAGCGCAIPGSPPSALRRKRHARRSRGPSAGARWTTRRRQPQAIFDRPCKNLLKIIQQEPREEPLASEKKQTILTYVCDPQARIRRRQLARRAFCVEG